MCYNVNYFVSQIVDLEFTSGSGFWQWVWIASGAGYAKPNGPDSCCIMWSTHNYGINKKDHSLFNALGGGGILEKCLKKIDNPSKFRIKCINPFKYLEIKSLPLLSIISLGNNSNVLFW